MKMKKMRRRRANALAEFECKNNIQNSLENTCFVQIFKPYMSSTAQSHPLLLFLLDVSSLFPLCASVIFGYFVSEENLINFSM